MPDVIAQVPQLISQALTGTGGAAAGLARLLSDEFADEQTEASAAVREIIERTRQALPDRARRTLDDIIDTALARIDLKAGLEYILKDGNGGAIRLTDMQKFVIDFFHYSHLCQKTPIVNAPTGSGKSMLIVGIKVWEIGQDRNTTHQIICSGDDNAEKRTKTARDLVESPHFRKLFPQIQPDRNKWGVREFLVKRSQSTARVEQITRDSDGNAMAIDATFTGYGIDSGFTGARAAVQDFDDLATEDNAVFEPKKGERIHTSLMTKCFSRKKQPIGVSEAVFRIENAPSKKRIIGTPWAQNDCVFRLRDWDGGTFLIIGINQTFTAMNVQIWGLPEKYIELLRRKYAQGVVRFAPLPDAAVERLRNKAQKEPDALLVLKYDKEYALGPGEGKDKLVPPAAVMEIPLDKPRISYVMDYLDARDVRSQFDRPYRCEVYTDTELAFPNFSNSCFTHYPGEKYKDEHGRAILPINVDKEPIFMTRNDSKQLAGWRAYMKDPPKDYRMKIGFVDLAGANRPGTTLGIAVDTPENRMRLIEINAAAVTGGEIPDLVGDRFLAHPDMQVVYIETVSLQESFVSLIEKHKAHYPYWRKIGHFTDTATNKNNQQIGILTALGTGLKQGGIELPNTWAPPYTDFGHGRNCPCGYCQIIADLSMQTRLAPVKSDVLITLWGLLLSMPVTFEPITPVKPSGYKVIRSGYELAQAVSVATDQGRGYMFGEPRQRVARFKEKSDGSAEPCESCGTVTERIFLDVLLAKTYRVCRASCFTALTGMTLGTSGRQVVSGELPHDEPGRPSVHEDGGWTNRPFVDRPPR